MSDRINCRNCIHFNDLEHRCCLNDGSFTQKECYFRLSNRKPKGKDVVIEHLKTKIAYLEAKLAESEKRIQAYEEIVEQKDKEISFANRDKTCIVKQLNDPKAYVLLEDYKQLKQQLTEKDDELLQKEKKIQDLMLCEFVATTLDFNKLSADNCRLREQLKNAIVPKFKKEQIVYSPLDLQDIYKGQIDVFDYYSQKYWVFFGDDIGCEWCCESELFKTKKEAQAKLEELKGENK